MITSLFQRPCHNLTSTSKIYQALIKKVINISSAQVLVSYENGTWFLFLVIMVAKKSGQKQFRISPKFSCKSFWQTCDFVFSHLWNTEDILRVDFNLKSPSAQRWTVWFKRSGWGWCM